MKLPEGLAAWVTSESRRAKRSKSAFVRDVLERHQQQRGPSALDLAADLCGCAKSGRRDLSQNRKYLKGFGR
jgi:hypothetical protein